MSDHISALKWDEITGCSYLHLPRALWVKFQFDLQWSLVCSSGSGGVQGTDLQTMAM